MRTVTIDKSRIAARMKLIEEHAQAEMDLDLDRTLATLDEAPDYKINNDEFSGPESVRAFYTDLFAGFPDLQIEITRRYVSDEAIIIEATFSGTHKNQWIGVPATGRRVLFPLCAIFPFDENDRLAGERVYFDSAVILRQLGALPRQ
ncbi:MAG: ester cyclase [Verrucomicrobia bacterium]|nr:ester cyclase [Verrucomicrobiota bacterium]